MPIERVPAPRDPRTAPFELLARLMPLPGTDHKPHYDRRLLHRIDLKDALK